MKYDGMLLMSRVMFCPVSLYFCWFFFSCHLKALELLQGLFQPVWLEFSHPLSSVHHSHHAQCRRFFTMASRCIGSFEFLDWISPLPAKVLFSLNLVALFQKNVFFFFFFYSVVASNWYNLLLLQVWGCWHLCCDVLGDHEDTDPCCDAVLLPDVSI